MPQSEAGTLGRPWAQAGLGELQTRPSAWRGLGWGVGQSPQRLGMHLSAPKRSEKQRCFLWKPSFCGTPHPSQVAEP